MQKRKLGTQGLEVSSLGLGCMGMSAFYGPSDEAESIQVLHHALELGINFWDTAELYGPFKNEELIGRTLKNFSREKIIIATKFAWTFDSEGQRLELNGSPTHIKKSIEGSLKRLGTDYIDLYYQHRLDPKTPIEETVGAMAELVKAGKVRYIGLSEVGLNTIRRAHTVHPLTAIQSEYSLWEREVEEDILPTLKELGIGFVAYSPIGRGFLSGKIKSIDDLDLSDFRRSSPRFQNENFQRNFELVSQVQKISAAHKATPAQIALAWLLRQGKDIVPIPGTRHIKYLEENAKTVELKLPESVWASLDKILTTFETAGLRYPEALMSTIDKTK
jgi:aryl-alcohol dehydrogenase-like predicted oxidoreductase